MRTKFTLNSITKSLSNKDELVTLKLSPVYNNSPENKEFWRWTPCGSIEVGTVNPEAVKDMVLGKEYYVDFTPA